MAVYFIRDTLTSMVKIGYSDDPWSRLGAIQSYCPGELRLVGLEEGGAAREAELHLQFAPFRERGEWFACAGSLARYIEAMPEPRRPKVYKTPKAAMINRLRAATGAAFQTCDAWVERGRIPGCYWKAIAAAEIYTLEELADAAEAFRPAPYTRKPARAA